MNKRLMVGFAVAGLVAALAVAGPAAAQGGGGMHGRGSAHGMGMSTAQAAGLGGGWMLDYMHNALADALGLTRAEFDAQLAAGATPWSLAQAQGLSADDFTALMRAARAEALAAAAADGAITQAQAEWMLSRGMGPGMMGGGAGRGAGQGYGRGTCPMYAAATPAP